MSAVSYTLTFNIYKISHKVGELYLCKNEISDITPAGRQDL